MNYRISRMGPMTRAERRAGRYLRAPDGHPDESAGGGDNAGGNSGDSGGSDESGNNTGQELDAEQFWKGPEDSSGKKPDGSDDDSTPEDFGKSIADGIQGLSFEALFTPEIGNEVAEGNLEGVNKRFNDLSRSVVQQSVAQSIKVMQHFGNQLLEQTRSEIREALGGEKDQQSLETTFPSMRDPAMKPVIQGIFKQAMKNTGNDRTKAIEMTRGMLSVIGQKGSKDFGIPQASNPDDFMGGESSTSLIDSLLGREK